MDDWASRPSTPKAETRCDVARDHQQKKNTKRTIAIRLRRDGSSVRALDIATVAWRNCRLAQVFVMKIEQNSCGELKASSRARPVRATPRGSWALLNDGWIDTALHERDRLVAA